MTVSDTSWSTQQLVEFLDMVASVEGIATASERAVERAAEALDAEIAAIVRRGALVASVGYPRGRVPDGRLIAASSGETGLEVEGLGRCVVATVPIGDDPESRLVVARFGVEPFPKEDLNLLRGMGRVLDLTLRMLMGLEQERALREHSERDSAERQAAEQKYRGLVEQQPGIVYRAEVGEFGSFRYVSPQIERILGFTPEEWIGDSSIWASRLHPEDRAWVIADELEQAEKGVATAVDYRMISKEGRVVWIHDEGRVQRDTDGAPVFHGVLYDVTESKLVEDEAQRLKNEFLGLVSHELRTPLTSIIGYVDLLSGDQAALSAKGQHSVGVIKRNANRLLRLVGDLLFAAQLEAGTFEIEPGPVRFDRLADECVEAALPRATEQEVELEVDVEPLPVCTGDPDRLAQAIDNLLSNAMKFTPAGGRVELSIGRCDDRVQIRVEDSGAGVPAAEMDRLFERFYQSSNATNGSGAGAGLGLAIVKAIIEGHGGSVGVDSEEGAGTTFLLEVPLTEWEDAPTVSGRAVGGGSEAVEATATRASAR